MPIKFHCEHCGKVVSAPDDAGGRRGRCPACKQVVFIPAPEAETLDLAPLDQDAERQRQKLVEEDLRKEHDLLAAQGRRTGEQAEPEEPIVEDVHAEGGVVLPEMGPPAGATTRDLIAGYLRSMAAGRLDQANAVAAQLRADPKAARAEIDRLLSDVPGLKGLADVPPPVLAGFLRQLQQQLK